MARIDPPSSIDGGSPVEANIVEAFACCNKILTTAQLVNLIKLALPYAQSKEGKKFFHVVGIVTKIQNGSKFHPHHMNI